MAWDDVPWEFGKTTEIASLIQTREDSNNAQMTRSPNLNVDKD